MTTSNFHRKVVASSFSALFLMISVGVSAKDGGEGALETFRISSTDREIKIDGVMNDEAWKDATVIELDYETSPGENVPPPVETEAYLIYSESYLYVGFKAYDPNPETVRAHLSDRDDIYGDDSVSVLLDTFNDGLRAFEFECNPLGIQRDATKNDAGGRGRRGGGDESWDAIWDSAGRRTDFGYTVEMAIPFNALSFPRIRSEQTWGLILSRDYPRNMRHNIRNVPEDRSRNCSICQASKIVGFQGISPGRNMEFTPTATAFRYDERNDFPHGDMLRESTDAEAGLTARWGITPNFNLFATVNPDFSQIEADAYQLEVNRQFALRYREKRPFFLEGRDYFSTPINAVYTRSIVDPRYGFKVAGKEGANSLGAYFARDAVTNLIFPGSQESDSETFEMESTAAVVRYRRDVLNNSTVGVIFTDREADGYYNRVAGVDGNFRLTSTDTVTFQFLGSGTKYNVALFNQMMEVDESESQLPEGSINDWAHHVRYEHRTRDWDASVSHSRMGEDFRADLGYLSRVGIQRLFLGGGPTWYGDSSNLVNRFSLNGRYEQLDEINGDLLEREIGSGFRLRGALQSSLNYFFNFKQQRYEDLFADLISHWIRGSLRPSGTIDIEMNVSFGDAIDYTHARPGTRLELSPELNLNLGRHLKIDFEHEYTKFDVEGSRLYRANVSQGRIIYQFNPRMFIRTILQYVDVRRNQAMYEDEIDPLSTQLFTQILFSYKVNPRTVFYLGYSDNHEGYQDIALAQANRAVFMKIGYAWVL
jgi:hypothetical protein